MKIQYGVLFLLASIGISVGLSQAQPANIVEFNCIGTSLGTIGSCTDGSTGLRGNANNTLIFVSTAGYFSQGDGGGGEFYKLGVQPNVCRNANQSSGATSMVGSAIIIGIDSHFIINLTVGESVSGSGSDPTGTIQTEPGTEIASVDIHHQKVALTLPLTGTATGTLSINVTFSGDNGGTLISDNYGSINNGNSDCYQKTNYRGEPHEWGAYGDGSTDDTAALQNWLGAYGNVSNLAPAAAPPNFGPWIATIPADYLVSQPLVCPAYANLQAGANIAAGTPNNGGGPSSPIVRILAAAPNQQTGIPVFSDTQGLAALMMASQYCRISGIALDVNGNGDYIFPGLSGSTIQNSSTVTLQNSAPQQAVPGMPLNDGGNCIPKGAVVTAAGGTNITMSVAASGTCGSGGSGDAITITGFYGVDVVGTHVGIDSHTLVERGFHNVHCADTQLDGLQLKDSQFLKSWDTGVYLTANCNDTRVIGDIISASGQGFGTPGITGAGLSFSGPDLSLESGIVEQSHGPNIILTNANLATVNGMVVDGSNSPGGTGMMVDNSTHVSICGNRFQRSGGDASPSSHVLLSGVLDNVAFCGNTYSIGSYGNDANVYPLYDFDVSTTPPTLTNVHIYDTPEQPAVAVFSPAALPILGSLAVPQFTNNQLSGLVMSNDVNSPNTVIDIAAGLAADRTNSTIIHLPPAAVGGYPACSVNFGSGNGPGHLDAGTVQPNTTYFIYLIAPAAAGGSAPNANCMASAALVPVFKKDSFNNTGYLVAADGGTVSGSTTVYNVNPLPGVMAGNAVEPLVGSPIPAGTTITAFSANAGPSPQPTAKWQADSTTITLCSSCSTSNFQLGMAILDTTGSCIPPNTYISGPNAGLQITISKQTICASSNGGNGYNQLSISGARQLVLSSAANTTEAQAEIDIGIGYYRLIGALYTDSSGNLVSFAQDGDTFYRTVPVADIGVSNLGNGDTTYPVASVPNGVSVEWLGRCVSSAQVIVYSPGQAPGRPVSFPTVPGYDVLSTSQTAEKYRIYTDTAQHIHARANAPNTTFQCMTDGWVFHRAQ